MKRSLLKLGGFTLIELVVSIVIFSVITAIVLSSNKTFGTNAKMVNASEDIVLALRQAQVYGISSKRNSNTNGNAIVCGTSAFDCRLGVNFSTASPSQFFVFVDVDDSKTYNTGDVIIETIPFATPIAISSIDCLPHITGCAGNVLNVTFKRPNPDAIIADTTTGGGYDEAHVVISDGIKNTTIDVSRTGQISLQ